MSIITSKSAVRVPDYGRHIQSLVEHCQALPTREERTRCARSILDIMRKINPSIKEHPDSELILWNHLLRIANYQIDIDVPEGVEVTPPAKRQRSCVPYPQNRVMMRQYGYHIERFIKKLPGMPMKDRRKAATLVANQMKKNYLTWVRPDVENETVYQDISRLSEGKICLSEKDVELRSTKKLRSELQRCPASDISKRAQKRDRQAKQAPAGTSKTQQSPNKGGKK